MSTSEPVVLVEKLPEGVTTITINRPHARNAVDTPTARLLTESFTSFENDDSQKVCVFSGVGNFCAGFDLHQVARNQNTTAAPVAEPVDVVSGAPGPMGPSRMTFSKPVIAAVSGHAVAGGLELSLLADIRVADSTAVFGVFCRRFGVPLIDGGTVRLQKVIGLGRAMDMILTGRPVGAEEALSFGLVNYVVEEGAAHRKAMDLARGLLAFPQKCMRADLRSTHYSAYDACDLEDALRFEFDQGSRVVEEESVQGATRFHAGEGRKGSFPKANM